MRCDFLDNKALDTSINHKSVAYHRLSHSVRSRHARNAGARVYKDFLYVRVAAFRAHHLPRERGIAYEARGKHLHAIPSTCISIRRVNIGSLTNESAFGSQISNSRLK